MKILISFYFVLNSMKLDLYQYFQRNVPGAFLKFLVYAMVDDTLSAFIFAPLYKLRCVFEISFPFYCCLATCLLGRYFL